MASRLLQATVVGGCPLSPADWRRAFGQAYVGPILRALALDKTSFRGSIRWTSEEGSSDLESFKFIAKKLKY
jgi:hypothetical protein